jgi:hypothetical protein
MHPDDKFLNEILRILNILICKPDLITQNDLEFIEKNVSDFIAKINDLLKFDALKIDFLTASTPEELCDNGVDLDYVYEHIFNSIQQKKELSVIRIADGEGAIYEYISSIEDEKNNNQQQVHGLICGAAIWKTWFGRSVNSESKGDLLKLSKNLSLAIKNASILCPPEDDLTKLASTSYVSYHGCRVSVSLSNSSSSKKYLSSVIPEELFVKTDFYEKLFSNNFYLALKRVYIGLYFFFWILLKFLLLN